MIDDYEKYCSKCIHKNVSETEEPCKECIDTFFKNCFMPDRTFIHFKEEKHERR